MSALSLWKRLRASAFRDAPFVLLGVFIGWNSDFSCLVKGNSMLPTLHPGEYLMFIPYSLLAVRKLVGAPLVRSGDVVVVKITNDLSVCKRITRMTASADEARAWGKEHFDDVDPSYFNATEDQPPREDKEWFQALSISTRSRDWDPCIERVPTPSFWLWIEGDNKNDSLDSRSCGAVPVECVRGRVIGVVWPRPRVVSSHSPAE